MQTVYLYSNPQQLLLLIHFDNFSFYPFFVLVPLDFFSQNHKILFENNLKHSSLFYCRILKNKKQKITNKTLFVPCEEKTHSINAYIENMSIFLAYCSRTALYVHQ